MCKMEDKPPLGSFNFAEDNKSVTERLDNLSGRVVEYLITKGRTLAAAESCTGGMISEKLTAVAGASRVYKGGVCSYQSEIKQKVLGVSAETLERYTVYSAETASEMSAGVMRLMDTDCAIGVTGIAGPSGGTAEKPVGTVYVSVRFGDKEIVKDLKLYREYENMDRDLIRAAASAGALEMLMQLMTESEDR